MRRISEFFNDDRLTFTEELNMSTLEGVAIMGTGGIVVARVMKLSPGFYVSCGFSEGAWHIDEVLAATATANKIADYLNSYYNPPKEGHHDDTGATTDA